MFRKNCLSSCRNDETASVYTRQKKNTLDIDIKTTNNKCNGSLNNNATRGFIV